MESFYKSIFDEMSAVVKDNELGSIIRTVLHQEGVKHNLDNLTQESNVDEKCRANTQCSEEYKCNKTGIVSTRSVFDNKSYGHTRNRSKKATIFDVMNANRGLLSDTTSISRKMSKGNCKTLSLTSYSDVSPGQDGKATVTEDSSSSFTECSWSQLKNRQTETLLENINLKYIESFAPKRDKDLYTSSIYDVSDVNYERHLKEKFKEKSVSKRDQTCQEICQYGTQNCAGQRYSGVGQAASTSLQETTGNSSHTSFCDFDTNAKSSLKNFRYVKQEHHVAVDCVRRSTTAENISEKDKKELADLSFTAPAVTRLNQDNFNRGVKCKLKAGYRNKELNRIHKDNAIVSKSGYTATEHDTRQNETSSQCLMTGQQTYRTIKRVRENNVTTRKQPCFCELVKLPHCKLPYSEQMHQCLHLNITNVPLRTTSQGQKPNGENKKKIPRMNHFQTEFADKEQVIKTLMEALKTCYTVTPRGGTELEKFLQEQMDARRHIDLTNEPTNRPTGSERTVQYFEAKIQETVRFAKRIPGFRRLNLDDQVSLIRDSHLDGDLPSLLRSSNREARIVTMLPGEHTTYEDLQKCFGMEVAEEMTRRVERSWRLNLTEREEALYIAIVITTSDRSDVLQNREAIEEMNSHLVDCLLHLIRSNYQDVGKRFGQLVEFMTISRKISNHQLSSVKNQLLQTPRYSNNQTINEAI